MAIACKCDRCGNFYDIYDTNKNKGNAIKIVSHHDRNAWGLELYDLCPECLSKIKLFLKNKDGLDEAL